MKRKFKRNKKSTSDQSPSKKLKLSKLCNKNLKATSPPSSDCNQDTLFVCKFCQLNIGDKLSLENHIYLVHLGVQPISCNECGHSSVTERIAEKHIKLMHPKIKIDEPTNILSIENQSTLDSETSFHGVSVDDQHPLARGSKFFSLTNLKETLKNYEAASYTQFSMRSLHNIDECETINGTCNPDLIFSNIRWTCVHGGRVFRSRSKGLRRNTKTLLQDCPAFIRAATDSKRQYLIIKEANFKHNHAISKEAYENLPRQRALSPQRKAEVAELVLDFNVDKRLVLKKLLKDTNKAIRMKDINNIIMQSKIQNGCRTESLAEKVSTINDSTHKGNLSQSMGLVEEQDSEIGDICSSTLRHSAHGIHTTCGSTSNSTGWPALPEMLWNPVKAKSDCLLKELLSTVKKSVTLYSEGDASNNLRKNKIELNSTRKEPVSQIYSEAGNSNNLQKNINESQLESFNVAVSPVSPGTPPVLPVHNFDSQIGFSNGNTPVTQADSEVNTGNHSSKLTSASTGNELELNSLNTSPMVPVMGTSNLNSQIPAIVNWYSELDMYGKRVSEYLQCMRDDQRNMAKMCMDAILERGHNNMLKQSDCLTLCIPSGSSTNLL